MSEVVTFMGTGSSSHRSWVTFCNLCRSYAKTRDLMESEDRSGTPNGRRGIVATVATMLPSVAALTGWRFINPSIIDGLLQARSEVLGLDPTPQTLRQMERHLLDLVFPHQIEITKGLWLDDLPDFIRQNPMAGFCALYLLPFSDVDADGLSMVFRYRVCFSDRADATVFRLNFG
jgi:hypothetical protein